MGGRDYCCIVGCSNKRSDVKIPFTKSLRNLNIEGKHGFLQQVDVFMERINSLLWIILLLVVHILCLGARAKVHYCNVIVDYVPAVNLPTPSLTPCRPKPHQTTTSAKARKYSEAIDTGLKTKPMKYCARKKLVMSDVDINDVQFETEISCHATSVQAHKVMDISHDLTTMTTVCNDLAYAKIGNPNCTDTTTASVQTNPDKLKRFMFKAIPVKDNFTQVTETKIGVILTSSFRREAVQVKLLKQDKGQQEQPPTIPAYSQLSSGELTESTSKDKEIILLECYRPSLV